ncbi:hypothetical protein Taro_000550, partial [Colocasia esculenta]|nr:hypothetical protein [Colocasia esculenta]
TPDRSREIISYKELKPVRPEVKLLHHLVVFNDVKLEVVMRNQWSLMGPGKSDEHPLYEELTVVMRNQ